jgi:glycosyltransferase involved in cell wall biosynthesis
MSTDTNQNKETLGRIWLVFIGRFPGEQAHSLFVAKSVEALHALGYESTVLAPDRERGSIPPKEYFQLDFEPRVEYIKTIDFAAFKVLRAPMYYVGNLLFVLGVKKFLKQNFKKGDVVYTNDVYGLPFVRTYPTCYELHDFPERYFFFHRLFYSYVKKILVTNTWKEKELHKHFPKTAGKTFVELNAVDLKKFLIQETKHELRESLGLKSDAKIVLYTGHLYGWKGAETLAAVAALLPEVDFYFLGGKPEDIKTFKSTYGSSKNIHVMGHQPHSQIPRWQKAADVLVIPNTGTEKISKYYTSPMKLFEYMASKVPIVASDLPSIREIADDTMVYFATPDDSASFAKQISLALAPHATNNKVELAYGAVSSHTWSTRADRIVHQLKQIV